MFVAPGWVSRDVEPNLQDVTNQDAVSLDSATKDRLSKSRDPYEHVDGFARFGYRETERLDGRNAKGFEIQVLDDAMHVAKSKGLRG